MTRKQKITGLMLLLFTAFVSSVSAAERTYSLLLAEFGQDSNGDETQTLVRYYFKDGTMVAKDNILTTKTDDLRYDLGTNQIYKDRYVITRWGDVIDLTTKQILFRSQGSFVGIDKSSDAVVIEVNDKDLYAFDLASHQYKPIQQPSPWGMPGTISPNMQVSASGWGVELWIYRPNGKRTLLGTGFAPVGSNECSVMPEPAVLWIDDKHLLTQREKGHIVIVDTAGKTQPLVTITDVNPSYCGQALRRDAENQIYFVGLQNAWRIDVAKRTFEPYLREATGNDFDVDYQYKSSGWRAIRYRGTEIGRWWCGSAVSAPGYIAVKFGPEGSRLIYPAGVKVWSAKSGQWTTVKPDGITRIIGWIGE